MKKIVALMLALCLVLAASAALAEDLVLKIGHIGPQTGPAATYGTATYRGAQIAADEITAEDNGITVIILNEDDSHDPEKSKNAYNNVMENGAQMIVGTTTTGPCIEVGALAYEERVFMLTPSASSTQVTEGKDNVYQLCFTDPNQGSASAAVINEKQLGTKIAIIYNNADAYSTGIYQTFIAKAEELGMEIVSTTTFTDETTDYSVQVAAAKDAGADLVFLPTSLAEGVMLLTPFVADAKDEKTQNFVAKYAELYNETPTQFAADGYDCVYALVAAAQIAGVTSDSSAEDICDAMIAAMQELEITGLTGTMTWSANGEVDKIPTAMVIRDGVYTGLDN